MVDCFNECIANAQAELREMAEYRSRVPRRSCLQLAKMHLGFALSWANRMNCADRKAMCMRVLGWIAADLRRMPA